MKLAIHTERLLFLITLSMFGVILVLGTCLVLVFRRSAKACATAACLSSASKRQTWALWAMIIGLVIFGFAWVSFLIRYRLAQTMPVAQKATPATFPRARNLLGVLPPYNPLHGRTGDPTQIQAAVAAYFQSHPASLAAAAIWKEPDEQGRTMLHWAAYRMNEPEFKAIFDKMPELANQRDIFGDTPLIVALEHGNAAAAKTLIETRSGVDRDVNRNLPNLFGLTALMYAAYYGDTDFSNKLAPMASTDDSIQADKIAQLRGHLETANGIRHHAPAQAVFQPWV